MIRKTSSNVHEFIEELQRTAAKNGLQGALEIFVLPGRKVRIKVSSHQLFDKVLDMSVELQTRWIMDRGIHIDIGVSSSGPVKVG